MKNIDIKSLIIGALFTSTIFLGVAATSPTDKWDGKQQWEIGTVMAVQKRDDNDEPIGHTYTLIANATYFKFDSDLKEWPKGWEPINKIDRFSWTVRRRIK